MHNKIKLTSQFMKRKVNYHNKLLYVEMVKTFTSRWLQDLHLSTDFGKSPVCQHKIDRNRVFILNTSVKRKRTNLLVLQMVGPRHGVSDASSWSVPPMIEYCTFGTCQVCWGLPLCAALCEIIFNPQKIFIKYQHLRCEREHQDQWAILIHFPKDGLRCSFL